MFAEKLDFLIRLTESNNSTIARACAIDPSHLSRLRRGKRPLPRKQNFLSCMTLYLARQIRQPWQRQAFEPILDLDEAHWHSPELVARALEVWLLDERKNSALPDPGQLAQQTAASSAKSADAEVSAASSEDASAAVRTAGSETDSDLPRYYYGINGKQEAVVRFLQQVLASPRQLTLYLFSDEEMDWIRSNPEFTRTWMQLLIACLKAGHRIVIVHSILRGMDEMVEGVRYWMPFYSSGQIESYYYPRIRDHLFRNTLFIVRGVAAVISASIQDDTSEMLNYYLTDPRAIDAELKRYTRHLKLCEPMFDRLEAKDQARFWAHVLEQCKAESPCIHINHSPSLWTMPGHVAAELADGNKQKLLRIEHERLQNSFFKKLAKHTCIEILPASLLEAGPDDAVPIHFYAKFALQTGGYTPAQLADHLEAMADLLAEQPHYSLILVDPSLIRYNLLINSGQSLLLYNQDQADIACIVDSQRMVSAFWGYVEGQVSLLKQGYQRDLIITQLKKRAAELRQPQ